MPRAPLPQSLLRLSPLSLLPSPPLLLSLPLPEHLLWPRPSLSVGRVLAVRVGRVLLASRTWAKLRNALPEDRKEVPLEGEGHYEGRATRWQAEPPPSLRRNGLTPARRCSRRSHRARASAGWARGALRGCRYSRTSRSRACQVDVVWIGCGSGAEGAVFVRACARVSRGVLAVRLASGSRPAPIPEWSAQVAARTTCTTEKDCPSCLRPSCRPDRNSRSQTACAGWPAHAWREVGGR